jgi:membrane protein required for colicin V production
MAFHHGGDIALLMARRGAPTPADLLAGHALAFIGVLVLVGAVGWLVRWLLRAIGLSGLDRLLGMALGIVRGGLVACMLVLVLGFTRLPQGEAWAHSRCLPVLMPGVALMVRWLPEWAASELTSDAAPVLARRAGRR